jgi:hypothetical protein
MESSEAVKWWPHMVTPTKMLYLFCSSLIREYNVSSQEKDATNHMTMGVRKTPPTT